MFEDFILDLEGEVKREVKGDDRQSGAIWFWVSLIFLVAAFVVLGYPLTVFLIIIGALLILLFFRYQWLGLYFLIFTSCFLGLVVVVPTGDITFVTEFFAGSVDFPLVDGIAILLFAAWLIKSLYLWKIKKFKRWQIYFPGILFFGLFIGVAALSVLAAGELWLQSLKYVIRPIMFFYLMYLVLPYNLIRNRNMLDRSLQVFYGAGIVSALIGFVSLFIVPATGILRRATPIGFWGISPLGENHNLLAEVLIAALPIGLVLFHQTKNKWSSLAFILGNLLIFAVALLTFARTAWIAIFLEIVLYIILIYRKRLVEISKYVIVFLLLLAPIIIYMYVFSTSYIATSSYDARLMLSEIAVDMLKRSPIIGQGAGTYVSYVENTYLFTLEFGDPMDAHGVLQKVAGEMGLLGLLALGLIFGYVIVRLARSYNALPPTSRGKYIVAMMLVMASGCITYQLFNTNYYSAKLWIPIALGLAAASVYKHEERSKKALLEEKEREQMLREKEKYGQ